MASPPLLLLPKEIEFQATTTAVAKSFKLENTSDNGVIYRIKTTAPKRYMVRPNIGYIRPKESVNIKVSMNLSKDPKADAKSDKFQVQSLFYQSAVPLDENKVKEIWSESKGKDLFKQRIKARILQDGASAGLDVSSTASFSVSESFNNALADSEVSQVSTVVSPRETNPVGNVPESVPVKKDHSPVSTPANPVNLPSVKEMNRYSTAAKTTDVQSSSGELEQLKKEKAVLEKQIRNFQTNSVRTPLSLGNILILLLTLLIGYLLAKIL